MLGGLVFDSIFYPPEVDKMSLKVTCHVVVPYNLEAAKTFT